MSEFRQFCIVLLCVAIFAGALEQFGWLRPTVPGPLSLLVTAILCACGWVAFYGRRSA